jgi:hypothetical protein
MKYHISIAKLRGLKEIVVYLGIPLLLVMSIHANSTTAQLVKSQNIILQAIQDAQNDGRLTAEQKSNLLICLALVPQDERSLDVANDCRKKAEANSTTSTTSTSGSVFGTGVSSPGTNQSAPSSNGSAGNTPAQSNNQQPANNQPLKVESKPLCDVLGVAC